MTVCVENTEVDVIGLPLAGPPDAPPAFPPPALLLGLDPGSPLPAPETAPLVW